MANNANKRFIYNLLIIYNLLKDLFIKHIMDNRLKTPYWNMIKSADSVNTLLNHVMFLDND